MSGGMKKPAALWEQQEGEPAKLYGQFVLYRDSIQRSLGKLSKYMGLKSTRALEHTCARWQWVKRAEAWDRELDVRSRQSQTDALVSMRSRHVQLGIGMQTAAVKELQALVHKIETASQEAKAKAAREGRDPEKVHHEPVLTVNEVIRLAEQGTQLERLSRGQPTSIDETRGAPPDPGLSVLSVEELKQIKALKAKMAGAAGGTPE